MKKLIIACVMLYGALWSSAQVSFANEKTDTTRINNMLVEVLASSPSSPGQAVVAFAEKFIDTPYKGHTLEGNPEMLRVNIGEVDCTTFVEMMMAMAITVDHNRSSWRDFTYYLQQLRYRGGVINGYPSRLHYIADWAVDNIHRGNFSDVTTTFPKHNFVVKTIDFMSSNADKYEALADSANLEGIKNVEFGYRSYRYPHIKTVDLNNKGVKENFRPGDILAFTSNIKNLDVTHLGILVIKDKEPYVLHASSSAGKVTISALPLADFAKKNRNFTGVRVFRLNRQ